MKSDCQVLWYLKYQNKEELCTLTDSSACPTSAQVKKDWYVKQVLWRLTMKYVQSDPYIVQHS